jgi:hypothetical protein
VQRRCPLAIALAGTIAICLLWLLALPALAQTAPPAPASDAQDVQEQQAAPDAEAQQAAADDQAKRIEELAALILEYNRDLAEADALDKDAETAGQDDALALRAASSELRFTAFDVVRKILSAVEGLGEDGVDTTLYREQIVGFLPSLSEGLHTSHAQPKVRIGSANMTRLMT